MTHSNENEHKAQSPHCASPFKFEAMRQPGQYRSAVSVLIDPVATNDFPSTIDSRGHDNGYEI